MLHKITEITRHSPPNKHDQWPKGTICKVTDAFNSKEDIWIQISNDQDNPLWEMREDNT